MRVLVDECLLRQLRQWLVAVRPDWTVMTVQDAGWASMKNGLLLRAADGAFDVLVTADRNMHHQQNFVGLDISVLVFPTNRAKLVRAGVQHLPSPCRACRQVGRRSWTSRRSWSGATPSSPMW